jgi:DNA-binding SARP family transcriptional activator
MLVVRVLGPLDILHDARGSLATVLAQPRRSALLAFLVVEGGAGFVRRDTLLALFWPESDEARGRAALRQALAFLRRSLGETAIRTRGDDEVGIDPTHVASDVTTFHEALAAGRDADALALYRGDFLGGLAVDGAPEFERWCARQRDALAREAAECALRLADGAALGADWRSAISLGQRALALEPFDESIHRRLLTWLDRSGDRAGALRAHEEFCARLAESLDAAPSPETTALVQDIRDRRISRDAKHRAAETGGGEADDPMHRAPSAPRLDRVAPALAPAQAQTPAVTPVPSASTSIAAPAGRRMAAGAAVVAVAAVALFLASRGPTPPSPDQAGRARADGASPRRIVVLPLDVRGAASATDSAGASGADAGGRVDPSLGAMAADWITEGISRIDGVEVVPATAVLATQRSLRSGDTDTSTSSARGAMDAWQAVARDVGAGLVVRGNIYRQGGRLHLQAHVVDALDGRVLRPVDGVSVPSDSAMVGIDRLRARVLAALAPLADTVTHLRRAVAPPSYEAYRRYVRGLEAFVTGDAAAALAHFRASASADPNYPMPRIAATIALLNLDDPAGAERLLTPLLAERDRLGPLEQATLDMVRGLMTGDLPVTYDAVVRQARIAPGTIGEYMVAETARRMNRPAEAVAVLRRLGPDRGELRGWRPYWRELTFALHLLERHDEELAAAHDARRRYPTDAAMAVYEMRALAARGEAAAVATALEVADGAAASAGTGAALRLAALTEWRAHGHPGGDTLLRAVSAWFDSLPAETRRTPSMRRQEARVRLLEGRGSAARDLLAPLLRRAPGAESPSIPTLGLAGVAAAASGDTAAARALMARIAERAASAPAAVRGASWGEAPYWRAVVAAQLADSLGALSLLRDARREGLGVDPSVHAEPSFQPLRRWPPFAALLQPADR